MAEFPPKRAKLKLRAKKSSPSLVFNSERAEETRIIDSDSSTSLDQSDIDGISRKQAKESESGDNSPKTKPSYSPVNTVSDVRQKIASLLPQYLKVDASDWRNTEGLSLIKIDDLTHDTEETKTTGTTDVETWSNFPKICTGCARRKPPSETQGPDSPAPVPSSPMTDQKPSEFLAENVEMTASEDMSDENIAKVTDPQIPEVYILDDDDDLPVEETPERSPPSSGVSQCPLCNLRFSQQLSQIDVDGHIAACYAAADDDVIW